MEIRRDGSLGHCKGIHLKYFPAGMDFFGSFFWELILSTMP